MLVVSISMIALPYGAAIRMREVRFTLQKVSIRAKHHRMECFSFRRDPKWLSASCNIPCMGGLPALCLTSMMQPDVYTWLLWPSSSAVRARLVMLERALCAGCVWLWYGHRHH